MTDRPSHDQIATWLDEIAEETANETPDFSINVSTEMYREAARRLRAIPIVLVKDGQPVDG